MEKVHQSLGPEGLHIPIALMRQYGLGPGSAVTLELLPEGIHIVPEQVEAAVIEARALRYLRAHVGDAATVRVQPLPDGTGWQVEVYGPGMDRPAGCAAGASGLTTWSGSWAGRCSTRSRRWTTRRAPRCGRGAGRRWSVRWGRGAPGCWRTGARRWRAARSTPPSARPCRWGVCGRRRGYARAVVAASLLDARAEGAQTAILFTGESNTAAQKAYVALGFRHIGAYRLLLLRTPREAAR